MRKEEKIKAFYDRKPNCKMCMEMSGWIPADFTCCDCKRILREEVEILQIGVGLSGEKSIIKRTDGSLRTVKNETITLLEDTKTNDI